MNTATGRYGDAPVDLGPLALPDWQEFLHYLYLPVRIPMRDYPDSEPERPFGLRFPRRHGLFAAVPPRLAFLNGVIGTAWTDAIATAPHLADPYIYVTARRGYATPGNPLSRPGWHADDFGGTDLNYIWSDVYPTRFLLSDGPLDIPTDNSASMLAMHAYANEADAGADAGAWIEDGPAGHLLRLNPYVIHDTPLIPSPGGMRSFFKISVSTHRYDLIGNSHNYDLDYEWPMYDRTQLHNQPTGGNRGCSA